MKTIKYPFGMFLIGFIINFFFRYSVLFFPGIIMLIVGIWVDWCFYASLVLLIADLVLSLLQQLKVRRMFLSLTGNNPFIQFQDTILNNNNSKNKGDFFSGGTERNTASEATKHNEAEKNNIVVDMSIAVCQKCNYGDELEKLNKHERVFYITQTVEQEVNNGGFSQFFFNSSGNLSNEAADAFTKIGAFKTADICKKAVSVFGGKVPQDREKRQDALENADCDDFLDECDNSFYKYEDNLADLNYAYIMAHRDSFD